MKQIQIAQHIDEPPHFLLWAVDEMVPPVLGIVAGILLGQLFYCLSAGLVVNHFYKRFRVCLPILLTACPVCLPLVGPGTF